MKHFIATILSLVAAYTGYAQDTPVQRKNEINVSLGLSEVSLLDQINSPLVYSSTQKNVQVNYVRKGAKSLFNFGFQVGRGSFLPKDYPERVIRNTTYDFEGVPVRDSMLLGGALTTGKIHLHYLRLISTKAKLKFYAGPGINEQIYYPDSFVRTGLMNSINLSLTTMLNLKLSEKSTLEAGLNIPVIAYNTRFPYHSTLAHPDQNNVQMLFNQGSELTSFHEFHQLDLNLYGG